MSVPALLTGVGVWLAFRRLAVLRSCASSRSAQHFYMQHLATPRGSPLWGIADPKCQQADDRLPKNCAHPRTPGPQQRDDACTHMQSRASMYRIVAEAGDCVSRELLLGQKLLGSAALVASEERSTQSIPSVENPKLVEQACDCSGVPTHSNPCPEQVLV